MTDPAYGRSRREPNKCQGACAVYRGQWAFPRTNVGFGEITGLLAPTRAGVAGHEKRLTTALDSQSLPELRGNHQEWMEGLPGKVRPGGGVGPNKNKMVPKAGLEPARLSPLPPQDSVSTNSTTSAHFVWSQRSSLRCPAATTRERTRIIAAYCGISPSSGEDSSFSSSATGVPVSGIAAGRAVSPPITPIPVSS